MGGPGSGENFAWKKCCALEPKDLGCHGHHSRPLVWSGFDKKIASTFRDTWRSCNYEAYVRIKARGVGPSEDSGKKQNFPGLGLLFNSKGRSAKGKKNVFLAVRQKRPKGASPEKQTLKRIQASLLRISEVEAGLF